MSRGSLFSLLGPAYAFKCLLSPVVQSHLWSTYNLPVLLSGLSALPIRPQQIKSLAVFQNKTFRGFLKLSKTSSTAALYFLLGQLPVEANVHMGVLTLFHNIWANPHITLHSVVKYILKMCPESSLAWSNHVQILCKKYNLPGPLYLLESGPAWSHERWKVLVKTKITVWFEKELRIKALTNRNLQYLNVQLLGLASRPHPALLNINSTQDAKKLRPHLQFLTGDFLTGWKKSQDQPGTDPSCKLCLHPEETAEHILLTCPKLREVKQRLFPELLNRVAKVQPSCQILQKHSPPILVQFILDCTSINLEENWRIPAHNPNIKDIFSVTRDWCFASSKLRTRLLRKISTKER